MAAVDVDQHAAEKLHAMMRQYAGDRPSSRVKDLVDLVLFAEAGVLDVRRLAKRLVVVYRERDDAPPPLELSDIPAAWTADYPALLAQNELTVAADTATSAHDLIRDLYEQVAPHIKDGPE